MRFFRVVLLLSPCLVAGPSFAQPKFEATALSMREALARGEIREFINFVEAKALQAEKNAASSPSPETFLREASRSYNIASLAARHNGQFQKAIAHGNKGFEIAEKMTAPVLQTEALYYLSFPYLNLGQPAKARELIEKGIERARKIPQPLVRQSYEGLLYNVLGSTYLRQGDNQKAIEHIAHSLQLQESGLASLRRAPKPNPNTVAEVQNAVVISLQGLANAHQRAGNLEEASKAYEKGIGIIKDSGIKTQLEMELYFGLGQIYLRSKDFSRALETLQKTLQLAEERRYGSLLYSVSASLGDLLLQTQKPAEAIPYYKKAIDSVESIRSLIETEESRSAFFEDKRAIYGGMVLANLRTKKTMEAFDYNERARSRAFLDILGSKVQLARGGTLLEHERALQARISVLQAMMTGQEPDSPQTPQLRKELAEAQQAYNEFLTKVRKENKEQASLINVEPLTLKQVQGLLDPGVTVLEYFVVQQAVLLWVVEKDRLRFVNIPIARTNLVSKVTSLREAIYQVGEKEKFNGFSQELYRLLIEPALPHVRGKELLVIPHDVLHYLPFQALLSSQGKYLIQDYPLYYLSSASLMQFTKEKRRASHDGEKALVMGNPSLGDDAYNLRFAEREAREVARIYPQSAVYLKAEATKPKTVSLSPNYKILHFAVHGALNEDDPLGSALLLASEGKDDGRLKVSEIFSLNLKADAVILSACETALGKISSGDEIIGLTRAFIYAGTPSVIATLWKVDDRASYELMSAFYSNLKTMTKSGALREAQLKTMKEFPQPFFWAAYTLTGEP